MLLPGGVPIAVGEQDEAACKAASGAVESEDRARGTGWRKWNAVQSDLLRSACLKEKGKADDDEGEHEHHFMMAAVGGGLWSLRGAIDLARVVGS